MLKTIPHTDLATARKLINANVSVAWFRRDLRLDDNKALYHALAEGGPVLPLFIFDTCILDLLVSRTDARVEFILEAVNALQQELISMGSTLLVLVGDPVDIFRNINPRAVYANHDYESYAIRRDHQVREILAAKAIPFFTYKDHVIFERTEVSKDNGEPYTVFTPYSRKWKSQLTGAQLKAYPTAKYFPNLLTTVPLEIPSLNELGFESSGIKYPERVIKLSIIRNYQDTRDFPFLPGTSKLSVHLRFGTVSIRKVVAVALKTNDTWLKELIWREFYAMILANFPHVESGSFKPQFDRIAWRNDESEFERWCTGNTGYPLVDAGMRELNATGFMHNRVRMITASFLTKHLLIDWRWGEAYFASRLLDYELSSNNGGWQWAAGTGCDASPYFRIFNPTLQANKFDPDQKYIRKWIPELDDATQYPAPIVGHSFARERAVSTYRKALHEH